jgi:hypothetical protein
MNKLVAVLVAVAFVAMSIEFVEARGRGGASRGGRGGGASAGRGGRRGGKGRNAKEEQNQTARENVDGFLRDAARDAL